MKHVVALSFGLIGLAIGVGLTLFSDDIQFYPVAIGFGMGTFVGYFIYGLSTVGDQQLKTKFESLGNLEGKTISDIVAIVGPYQLKITCPLPTKEYRMGWLYSWTGVEYKVNLLFDEKGLFFCFMND